MTVDIVLRTKDRPAFLARALDDVLAQTHTDWRLIVVNDGGAPVAEAVAARPGLADRTDVVDLPETLGRAGAVNAGIEAGGADLITWHDDDDTWHPEFLERTTAHLAATDDAGVCVRTEVVWEEQFADRIVESRREIFHPMMLEPTFFDLLRFNHVLPISLVYRRSVHDTIGPVDVRLHAVSDWDFNLRLWAAFPVGFLDEVLAFWHRREGGDGHGANSVEDRAAHIRYDRQVRDEAVRDYVQANGAGELLYLAKYVDERTGDLHARLDRIEAQQAAAMQLIRQLRR